jgi:hypothetical protein
LPLVSLLEREVTERKDNGPSTEHCGIELDSKESVSSHNLHIHAKMGKYRCTDAYRC